MGLVSESLTRACYRMLAPSIAQSLCDELLQTNNAEQANVCVCFFKQSQVKILELLFRALHLEILAMFM